MSHLTLAGRKCKVGDKKGKCIFHGKRSGPRARGSGKRRLREDRSPEDVQTGRRLYYKPWEKAKRKRIPMTLARNMTRKQITELSEIINPSYIPKFDSIRTGARATSREGGRPRVKPRGRAWWKRALDEVPGPTGRRAGDWKGILEDFMTYAGLR